jgi:molybdopterin adenylyltransferase
MKIGRITFTDPEMAARSSTHNANFNKEIERVISSIFSEPSTYVTLHVANDRKEIQKAIMRLCDEEKCPLVLTNGGTGPAAADIMPDATMEIVDRKLPGFGEVMRYYSYERFKVSVLSRAEAGVRGQSLIINMPSRPKAVLFCMRLLQEGIAEALEQIAEIKPGLRGDEIVVPIDKYLPFLKKIRPKPTPGGENHPSL